MLRRALRPRASVEAVAPGPAWPDVACDEDDVCKGVEAASGEAAYGGADSEDAPTKKNSYLLAANVIYRF